MLMIMILMSKTKSSNSNNSSLKNLELLICKRLSLFIIEIQVQCLNKEDEVNLLENLELKININHLTLFKKVPPLKRDKSVNKKLTKPTNQVTIKMKKKNFLQKTNLLDPQCKNPKLQNQKQKEGHDLEIKRKVL